MSVESSISALLSTLKSISTSTKSQAISLVQQSGDVFTGVVPPDIADIDFNAVRTTTDPIRVPNPPSTKDIAAFVDPIFSPIQNIDTFTGTFTKKAQKLNLPSAINTKVKIPSDFTKQAPSDVTLTIRPDMALASLEPTAPVVTAPKSFSTNPVSGNPPEVPAPKFDEFTEDFYTEYENGLRLTAKDLAEYSTWIKGLYSNVINSLDGIFTTRMRAVLLGTETAVPVNWETETQTQAIQDLRSTRQDAINELDNTSGLITGLPSGQRSWSKLNIELNTLRDTIKTTSKIAKIRREKEVKHLEWAMQLCAQWVETALTLRTYEVGWRMKGFQLALNGASQALALAVKVLENKEKEIIFFTQYNEAQSRRTSLRLKLEETKLTRIKTVLESNKLINDFNQNQLKIYEGSITIIEQRVKKYQTQLEYLSLQQELEKLKLRKYDAQIKAFEANVNAYSAETKALNAQIKGDISLMDGELLKVQSFKAQVKVFEAEIAALSTTIMAQAAQNNALLGQYNALLDGKLNQLKMFDKTTRIAVTSLMKGYDAEAAQMSLEMQNQDLEDRVVMDNAIREMQKDHTDTILAMEEYGILFAQRQAEGAVISQGAGTMGNVATQSFSGLNSVGALEIVEVA